MLARGATAAQQQRYRQISSGGQPAPIGMPGNNGVAPMVGGAQMRGAPGSDIRQPSGYSVQSGFRPIGMPRAPQFSAAGPSMPIHERNMRPGFGGGPVQFDQPQGGRGLRPYDGVHSNNVAPPPTTDPTAPGGIPNQPPPPPGGGGGSNPGGIPHQPPPPNTPGGPPPGGPPPTTDPNDLTHQTFVPGGDPNLRHIQNGTNSAYGNLDNGQTRYQAALDTMKHLDSNLNDQFKLGSRDIGQTAAAMGRMGSGMVTTDLGNLDERLQLQRQNALRDLSAQTTEGDINDRYRKLQSSQDLEDQRFQQGLSNRGEYRTERGYQSGQGQQDFQNQITNRTLGDQEQQAAWQRALDKAKLAAVDPNADFQNILNTYFPQGGY